MQKRTLVVGLILMGLVSMAAVADWNQWRGPNRDGKSSETGLSKKWPPAGPKLLWTAEGLGEGYSTVALSNGTIYATGMVEKTGYLFAFDLKGKLIWKKGYGAEFSDDYPGARSTPTIDGDRVYVMSGLGRLVCMSAADGKTHWAVNTSETFKGVIPRWGVAESVLVDEKNVYCTPGGPDASVVALDKLSGKTVWTSKGLGEPSAYCSPILVSQGKRRLLVTMVDKSIVGIDAADGKVLWRKLHETDWSVQANTPVYRDGTIYATSGYGSGGVLLKLGGDGSEAVEQWRQKGLDAQHGGVVEVDGFIYGSTHKGAKKWMCLDMRTGEILYEEKGVGMGSVAWADGMLYCLGEKGKIGLAEASPKGYTLAGSFDVPAGDGPLWAHPVISGGRLYVRHGDALMAFDIKSP